MNRIRIFIVCSAFMLLLTGCNGWYRAIDKDTVMVKKISNEQTSGTVEFEGVLSEEAMKTISVNAINKYYGNNLTLDDIESELSLMDQQQIKSALADITKKYDHLEQGFLVEYKSQLSKVPAGIYFIYVNNKYDANDSYTVIVNPRDGDIVSLSKNYSKTYTEMKPTVQTTDIKQIADTFIESLNEYRLSDLELDMDEGSVLWGSISELFYHNKNDRSIVISVAIDKNSGKAVGFNKDIIAVLRSTTLLSYARGDERELKNEAQKVR